MSKRHIIINVKEGSIAQELEIEKGDILLEINGEVIKDIFDYQFLIHDEEIVVVIQKENGEEWELEIEKEYGEDLGLEFEESLMDSYKSCKNKCIFCFIDQMPKGMRETLYFKDDDARLSFLQGNYITLTNMSEEDVKRIVKYHLGPINISFQTTNPKLRCEMLNNRFAGEALKKVDILYKGQIEMNGQIVLCKGVNDKEELERSIRDLTKYLPYLRSVSVVPVGISKYREGLYPLQPFSKKDAKEVLDTIHRWQEKIVKECGTHFIHAGDEWYILAGEEIPMEESYDGYLQLENGVGMLRLLKDEFEDALKKCEGDDKERRFHIATGEVSQPFIEKLMEQVSEKFTNTKISVYPIHNKFFGEHITVTGLITGQDLIEQLREKKIDGTLLLSEHMFRDGEEVFLDDITLSEVKEALQCPVYIVKSSGYDLIDNILNNER